MYDEVALLNKDGTINISGEWFNELRRNHNFLLALNKHGVALWHGYSKAAAAYYKEYNEEETYDE